MGHSSVGRAPGLYPACRRFESCCPDLVFLSRLSTGKPETKNQKPDFFAWASIKNRDSKRWSLPDCRLSQVNCVMEIIRKCIILTIKNICSIIIIEYMIWRWLNEEKEKCSDKKADGDI